MARTRFIKPGFFTNEYLAALPPHTRLLFIGLWTLADKAGRMEDRPMRIKAVLFPYENADVDSMLNQLCGNVESSMTQACVKHDSSMTQACVKHDSSMTQARRVPSPDMVFIKRYATEGGRYIQIVNWTKHQMPHHKETDSEIPPMPQVIDIEELPQACVKHDSSMTQACVNVDSTLNHKKCVLPSLLPLCLDTLNLEPNTNTATASQLAESVSVSPPKRITKKPKPDAELFARFWAIYPRRDKRALADEKFAVQCAKYDAEMIISQASAYAAANANVDPQYLPQASTWLNGRMFLDDPSEWVKLRQSNGTTRPVKLAPGPVKRPQRRTDDDPI